MKLGGFHIILVPPDASKTKRIKLSSITVGLLVVSVLVAIPLILGSLFSTAHYQNRLNDLKVSIAGESEVIEQKEAMTSRLMGLERHLIHAEQSLDKLENALDLELGHMEAGLGPIIETNDPLKNRLREIPLPDSDFDSVVQNDEVPAYQTLRGKMNRLDYRILGLTGQIDEIYELNEDKIRFLESTPNLMPVEGWITSSFGFRRSPYSGTYRMHYGIDIASPYGSSVKAPADGKVLLADYKGGYGRKVILDHGFGVSTVYAHASRLFVKEGDLVKRGDAIATVGSTGASTGPHLHYEVHVDGIPSDPLKFTLK